MLIGQVERKKIYANLYHICLAVIKIALLFNLCLTTSYMEFFELGLYPKNKKKGEKLWKQQ